MGRDISSSHFTEQDMLGFKQKLREESALLADWFKSGAFGSELERVGFELERYVIE